MSNKPVMHFYEKPGCINNSRQKNMLRSAGVELVVHDLLTTPWQAEELSRYLADKPIVDCFNKTAPAVKSGAIKPETFDKAQALQAMMADPILIRRPLMRVGDWYQQGFDWTLITEQLALTAPVKAPDDIETCVQQQAC